MQPPSARSGSAAERMRQFRERRREGLLVVSFQIRDSEVADLIRRGLLARADRANRQAAVALGKLLDRVLAPRPA